MKQDRQVREYSTRDAKRFDNIYEEGRQRSLLRRLVDVLFRRRELRQRVEACLRGAGDAGRVLEIGCGSGRVAVADLIRIGTPPLVGSYVAVGRKSVQG